MAQVEAPPKHQPGSGQEVWMYPSEQMFFNAMKRKVCSRGARLFGRRAWDGGMAAATAQSN